jgi:hypothetical protein
MTVGTFGGSAAERAHLALCSPIINIDIDINIREG